MYHAKRKSYRRKTRKSNLRKRFSRRKARASKVLVKGPRGMVFPDRYFCKLRYNHLATLSGTTTGYTQIYGNSCYDPLVAVGGGQPMGFDQLSQLYLKYRVHRCDIKIRAVNQLAVPVYITCYPLTTTSAPAGLESDLEQRYSKSKVCTALNAGGYTTLTNSMKTKKLFGVNFLDDIYEAFTSTNPSAYWCWNVGAYSTDGATNMQINLSIEVTYYVEWKNPVRLAVS